MSITSDQLKNSDTKKRHVIKETKAILGRIDEEIKIAHEYGLHFISYMAPISFNIPFMSNKDAQRCIYSSLIKSLINRGFETQIEIKTDASIIEIKWLSAEEILEVKEQMDLLKKYTKKNINSNIL
jgi:hypothetical protein